MIAQADLAGRDFAAERGESVVVSTGAPVGDLDLERNAVERAEVQVGSISAVMRIPCTSNGNVQSAALVICNGHNEPIVRNQMGRLASAACAFRGSLPEARHER